MVPYHCCCDWCFVISKQRFAEVVVFVCGATGSPRLQSGWDIPYLSSMSDDNFKADSNGPTWRKKNEIVNDLAEPASASFIDPTVWTIAVTLSLRFRQILVALFIFSRSSNILDNALRVCTTKLGLLFGILVDCMELLLQYTYPYHDSHGRTCAIFAFEPVEG